MSLVVVRALGLCTVQDTGRLHHMHEGVPHGGALVPELLVRANRLAGNHDGAAAIEVLGRLVVRATTPMSIATDVSRLLRVGEEVEVVSEPRRVAYLAVRGGIDCPVILDGRGAFLSAGISAPLRVNDEIDTAGDPEFDAEPEDLVDGPIELVPGPDLDAFAPDALATLCAAPYRIDPSSNRVGTRLAGKALSRVEYRERSRPLAQGAIEVPRDGQPIVLGPDHPTTGGYPVIAVVAHADLGRFHAIRLGGTVQFRVRE
jgi:allophanate hydrolase subunit 2